MTIPTSAWDETAPAGNQPINLGDDAIRIFKTQIREVIASDHFFQPSGQHGNNGRHNRVSFVRLTAAPPVPLPANDCGWTLYTRGAGVEIEMAAIDRTGTIHTLTRAGSGFGCGWTGGFRGEIRMFRGLLADIPSGWVICDGLNGTPNLLDRFIVGASRNTGVAGAGYAYGDIGGSNDVAISVAQMPSHNHNGLTGAHSITHNHTATATADGAHTHDTRGWFSHMREGGGTNIALLKLDGTGFHTASAGAHGHTVSVGNADIAHQHTINSEGGGVAHENRPPFFALFFIMKVI